MTKAQPNKWDESDEAQAFIESANSRETSIEIMKALAFFARNASEAESLWNGDGFGKIAYLSDIVEHVTKNGLIDAADFCWGASGTNWAQAEQPKGT